MAAALGEQKYILEVALDDGGSAIFAEDTRVGRKAATVRGGCSRGGSLAARGTDHDPQGWRRKGEGQWPRGRRRRRLVAALRAAPGRGARLPRVPRPPAPSRTSWAALGAAVFDVVWALTFFVVLLYTAVFASGRSPFRVARRGSRSGRRFAARHRSTARRPFPVARASPLVFGSPVGAHPYSPQLCPVRPSASGLAAVRSPAVAPPH